MYIFLDKHGVLKEIINDRKFRAGDSKRDKIYVYWDGEHAVKSAWIKYIKANEAQTTETKFYDSDDDRLVGKELPTEPVRNLEYFNYDHTYIGDDGLTHIGYQFFEITVSDEVLASATADANVCIAIIRFVLEDGSEQILDQAGVIPFSVEATKGIIPDASINETQYNYLIKLIEAAIALGGGFELKDLPEGKNYKLHLEVRADGNAYVVAKQK